MPRGNMTAKIGEPSEMLIGEGANQSVARIRKILIQEDGKTTSTLTSADSQDDVLAQIDKAGYIPGAQVGDTIALTPKPMSLTGKAVLGCGGLVALIMVLIIGGCTVSMFTGGDKKNEPTEYDARYYCQEFVKDKLKAPSTAKFSDQTASGSGASWSSSGTVEAQNTFGGMVASRYSCTLSYNADEESWRGTATLVE